MFRGQEALAILCAMIPVFPPTLIVLLALENTCCLRAFLAERLAYSAGIFCSAGEQCLGNPRHTRPNLPHSVRGCIAHPGPLGRERLGVRLSS